MRGQVCSLEDAIIDVFIDPENAASVQQSLRSDHISKVKDVDMANGILMISI